MKTFMKQIRNANTNEELKAIMVEVLRLHAAGNLSDEAFGKIFDVFEAKKNELN